MSATHYIATEAGVNISVNSVGGRAIMKAELPDESIVCRGGTCTAKQFAQGSGARIDSDGALHDLSVNCSPNGTLDDMSKSIPNRQIGSTTVRWRRRVGANAWE